MTLSLVASLLMTSCPGVLSRNSLRTTDGRRGMQKRRGLLNLEPEYQRGFVWDITASSRLVETILLGLPVPEACSQSSHDALASLRHSFVHLFIISG